ncbi:hypothetical protein DWX11_10350 [Ruminococcus sp. AF18-29]|nr:hypothetical protein DWX72_13090 [Ruminococcus sp. AF21-11]RGG64077.1 hypothetical protein DWX11_10350 [Ruminococcus sp. AF18-29]
MISPFSILNIRFQVFIFIVKVILALINNISDIAVDTHNIRNKLIYIFFEIIKSVDLIFLSLCRRFYRTNYIVNIANADYKF